MGEKELLKIIKEFNKWINEYWCIPCYSKGDILKEWGRITKDIDLRETSPKIQFLMEEKIRKMEMRSTVDKASRE